MDMDRSPVYYWGVAVGILVALAAVWVIKRLIMGKRSREKREYDERQQQAMGKACKYGYYTLSTYLGVIVLFDLMTGIRWASLYTAAFLGILLSVGVFGIVGIKNDAYYPFRQSPKRYIALFTVLGAMNVAIGVIQFRTKGTFIEDGLLSYSIVNPLMGVLLLVLAAAMAVKAVREKHTLETEDMG